MTPQQFVGLILVGLGALVVLVEIILTNIKGREEGCMPYLVGGGLMIAGGTVINTGHT